MTLIEWKTKKDTGKCIVCTAVYQKLSLAWAGAMSNNKKN